MKAPLTQEQLGALAKLDTCTVANAIETFDVRLRNEGFADSSIRCITPRLEPMVGYAVTVRIKCANMPPRGVSYVARTDWWDFLVTVPAPRVVVIQDIDETPGIGAFLGDVHASILQRLGCVGAITSGTVRDVPSIAKMPFQLFAAGLAVSHAYVHIVDYDVPVTVGGLEIKPGDLLHADVHGVLSVPLDIAPKIPAAAEQLLARERAALDLCKSDGFSPDKLRAAVKGIFD